MCPFVLQDLNHRKLPAQAQTCAVHLYAKISLLSTIILKGLSRLVEVSRREISASSLAEDTTNQRFLELKSLLTSIFSSQKVSPLTLVFLKNAKYGSYFSPLFVQFGYL